MLGSFVNGLFLAALLMSAAIEGIQTCFHASHSNSDNQSSILHIHPLTYPMLLTGFAVVGIIMQWCSMKVHEMRDIEIKQMSSDKVFTCPQAKGVLSELDPDQLVLAMDSNRALGKDNSYDFVGSRSTEQSQNASQISLKSIAKLEQRPTIAMTVDLISQDDTSPENCDKSFETAAEFDSYCFIRYLIAPIALVSCALIVYFIQNETVTEIADAFLSIIIVIMQFVACYPPMKRSGRVLLQSAPYDVDLERLKQDLLSISEHLIAIKELNVWSLTSSEEGRVGTCQLVLQRTGVSSEKQISSLVALAGSKFAAQGITCVSIEPRLVKEVTEADDSHHHHDHHHDDHHHHHD